MRKGLISVLLRFVAGHMWTQIVGKIRMAHAPLLNHWWQVTLYVSPRGLTTSAVPHRTGAFEIEFDFVGHRLEVRSSDGGTRSLPLRPMPVAEFYTRVLAMLDQLGIEAAIRPHPNEVEPAIPFAEDHVHASYDGEAATLFWRRRPGDAPAPARAPRCQQNARDPSGRTGTRRSQCT